MCRSKLIELPAAQQCDPSTPHPVVKLFLPAQRFAPPNDQALLALQRSPVQLPQQLLLLLARPAPAHFYVACCLCQHLCLHDLHKRRHAPSHESCHGLHMAIRCKWRDDSCHYARSQKTFKENKPGHRNLVFWACAQRHSSQGIFTSIALS